MTLQLVPLIAGAAVLVWALIQRSAVARSASAREVAAGMDVLRLMGWAEFAKLVVQSFEARGFTVETGQRKLGEGGIDIVLLRNGTRHLMQVKHGGAYHVGAGPVRTLGTTVAERQAAGGILATSGGFDASAREAARGQPLTLLDGEPLWSSLRGLLPSRMVMDADERASEAAAAQYKKANGHAAIGLALLLIGGAWLAVDFAPSPAPTADTITDASDATATQASVAPAVEQPVAAESASRPASNQSIAPPPLPSEEELAQQRDFAAAGALLVNGVAAASWSSKSTLNVALREVQSDEQRAQLLDAVCARVTAREALRFTRLQVSVLSAPSDDAAPPRWFQCR